MPISNLNGIGSWIPTFKSCFLSLRNITFFLFSFSSFFLPFLSFVSFFFFLILSFIEMVYVVFGAVSAGRIINLS